MLWAEAADFIWSAESATHHSAATWPPNQCPYEAGRWPAMTKTTHEPRALPWADMSQAFGLNARTAAPASMSSPQRRRVEDVGNAKAFRLQESPVWGRSLLNQGTTRSKIS